MSEHLKSDIVFSAIIAAGIAVPVGIGILESRPPVWEGEIVFEKVERKNRNAAPMFTRPPRTNNRYITWEELGVNSWEELVKKRP